MESAYGGKKKTSLQKNYIEIFKLLTFENNQPLD